MNATDDADEPTPPRRPRHRDKRSIWHRDLSHRRDCVLCGGPWGLVSAGWFMCTKCDQASGNTAHAKGGQ